MAPPPKPKLDVTAVEGLARLDVGRGGEGGEEEEGEGGGRQRDR